MSDWAIVRHQVAVAGRVTGAQTGRPIPGVPTRKVVSSCFDV
jgi:hypothetical protein